MSALFVGRPKTILSLSIDCARLLKILFLTLIHPAFDFIEPEIS
jgi:hypothetical protein